jgi:hypothetical protein
MKNNIKTIGFTGSQSGMSLRQQGKLIDFLEQLHDENCDHQITLRLSNRIGSDHEMYEIGKMMGYEIILHPSVDVEAYVYDDDVDVEPPNNLKQNIINIINVSDMIIVCMSDDNDSFIVNHIKNTGKNFISI